MNRLLLISVFHLLWATSNLISQDAVEPTPVYVTMQYAKLYNPLHINYPSGAAVRFEIPLFTHFSMVAGIAASTKDNTYYSSKRTYSNLNHLNLQYAIGHKHQFLVNTGISHYFAPDSEMRWYFYPFIDLTLIDTAYSSRSLYRNYFGWNWGMDYRFHFAKKLFLTTGFDFHYLKSCEYRQQLTQFRLGAGFKI